ncbi:hypothetical protein VNO80_07535 [Phaseolus coccineus]|uniref:Uncharacterized protein n=1 Tax=Phaseolus coccineus TaxID=3886 RepID=A0AAN9NPC3_PHACN
MIPIAVNFSGSTKAVQGEQTVDAKWVQTSCSTDVSTDFWVRKVAGFVPQIPFCYSLNFLSIIKLGFSKSLLPFSSFCASFIPLRSNHCSRWIGHEG